MTFFDCAGRFWASEMNWLALAIQARIEPLMNNVPGFDWDEILSKAPPLEDFPFPYAELLAERELGGEKRLALALGLAPYIQPEVLDPFQNVHFQGGRRVTQFGGTAHRQSPGFLPTGETALFLLGGGKVSERLRLQRMFDMHHVFFQSNLLSLGATRPEEPRTTGVLRPSEELLALAKGEKAFEPAFSPSFPASKLTSPLAWNDVVLSEDTAGKVMHLRSWIKHETRILADLDMRKTLQPGYRALFYGPPGTGKTLTATLLGKTLRRSVYRVDLSAVVSKYIGETEKNLERIFTAAENRDWILFFDEADALFGKRTSVKDSHDRYANQEVSYLLQRIEGYRGIVILASNDKKNIDEAFSRRFQAIIHFPAPTKAERLQIWQGKIPSHYSYRGEQPLEFVADKFPLSGGSIVNVIRYCAVKSAERDELCITYADILEGIAWEYGKVGKFMPSEFKQAQKSPIAY